MTQSFFNEATEQSEIKSLLVNKYFWAWAKIMISTQKRYRPNDARIAYIDLFAGPGRYENGQLSTPLLVLQQAIDDNEMRQRLVTVFNDKDKKNIRALQKAIDSLPGVDTLKHKPLICNHEVGEDIAETFEQMSIVPTLFFVDPWGYRGLSLRLINAVVKDFGCDCIFFFNYNRINMVIGNKLVIDHINALFGKERADNLREQLVEMTPSEREQAIVHEICKALKEMGGEFVLPFGFKNSDGRRTSHHLIFVSKHVKGYEIMKEIMARHSSTIEQGVASFDFNPVANRQFPLLFNLSRPLDDLAKLIMETFAGKTLTMKEIYNQHHVDTPYISSNYKDALNRLEDKNLIICDPPANSRRVQKGKRTFADTVQVTFPAKNRRRL